VNVLERWTQEELTRVPPGLPVAELRRRVRARRARLVVSLAAVAIVLTVLGIAATVHSPAPHRVRVVEPAPTTTGVSTPTLPLATTQQVPPLAKIVNSVIADVQRKTNLQLMAPPTSAEIVRTTVGRADALHGARVANPGKEIYLVQVIGDFTCRECGLAERPPHGRVLQSQFDKTGDLVGFSVGANRPDDLATLGTVYRVSLVRPLATTAQFPALVKMADVVSNNVRTDDRLLPGAAHPTSAEIVETTRARAFPLFGGQLTNLSSHIYVVQVIGNFTCDECSRPSNAVAPPHGRALHLLFDDAGNGYGFGIGPDVLDLGHLGTVYQLPLG
jgi:hypothetical protein